MLHAKLLKAVRLMGGKDGNEHSDAMHCRASHPISDAVAEDIDLDERIRQWLLDSRPPTTQFETAIHSRDARPPNDPKHIPSRHSIDCGSSAQSYHRKILTATAITKAVDDVRHGSNQPLSAQSNTAKTKQEQRLRCRPSEEISRPSKPRDLEKTNTVLYHPDFADWSAIKPAEDAWNPSCDKSRSSSEFLHVLDDATAVLSKLLPFSISGEAIKIRSH